MQKFSEPGGLEKLLSIRHNPLISRYLHWDRLRHYPLPEGTTREDVWLAIKLSRSQNLKHIPLTDKSGKMFSFVFQRL